MIPDIPVKDLVLLAADDDILATCRGLLNHRHKAMGIRPVTTDFFVHPDHDPGCLRKSEDFLRPLIRHFLHAVVIFDHKGCGKEERSVTELEEELTVRLSMSGWENRAAVVVIDPELESWVFSDSPEVDGVLGWTGRMPSLRKWLEAEGYINQGQRKPPCPKEAVEAALRQAKRPRSASIYGRLAEKVGLSRCDDRAFLRFKSHLRSWFPISDQNPK